MVALSEIYQLDQHVTIYHDVIRLQIQVNNPVVPDIPQCLYDRKNEVKLSSERDGNRCRVHILLEIFGWDKVHNNRGCMWICLIDDDVILGQEDRRTILDHRQHFQLMRIAAIDTPLFFLLDYDILMQHLLGSLAIQLRRMHQLMLLGRVHVEVFDFCEVDGTEAALVDLVESEVREVMDVDVVEDHEVFVWVAVAWLGGHCDHRPDVFELLLLKDEVFLLLR